MASDAQIADLRRKISESDETTWTDDALAALIDAANGDLDSVASSIWEEKAASYAELVDISEAGSSRKNSQLYSNALKMAKHYGDADAADDDPVAGVDYPTTRPIVRAL